MKSACSEMKPLIATPAYGGMVCVNYLTSVLRLQQVLPVEFYFRQDSLITRARNDCVAHFRAGGWTHLFFIDADIGFEPEAVVRLLSAGYPVAAGVYPIKHEDAGFPIDLDAVGPIHDDGFASAEQAPTGFMCVERSVFERMHAGGIGKHEFFDTLRQGDDYLSEDYAFCQRWRSIGGQVHVDTRCRLSHQGLKLYEDSPWQ